jgi:hypothetical protein
MPPASNRSRRPARRAAGRNAAPAAGLSGGRRPPRQGATTLVLGCGALAQELLAVVRANDLDEIEVRCLPAPLHNHPDLIAGAVDEALTALAPGYERVFVAYADCGTAGALDAVLDRHEVERLPGAHCYAFYAGLPAFDAIHNAEPGTFYLTDFLARSFDTLVVAGLGLDRHPHLLESYFGNYTRLVYLSQRDDPELLEKARRAAERLDLRFEHVRTGYGELGVRIAALGAGAPPRGTDDPPPRSP